MTPTTQPAEPAEKAIELNAVGFLTVLHEANGYVGGYLVTNVWGRPLEFRLSSAVQPNRVQQVLYASTLEPYVCGELIGKALVDRAGVPAQLIVTDTSAALDLRMKVEVPVVWLAPADNPRAAALASNGPVAVPASRGRGALLCHPRFLTDAPLVRELLDRVAGVDLAEPFLRIREAISEARKLGAR
jgi:hypothetical protein